MANYLQLLMSALLLQRRDPARWQSIRNYVPVKKDVAEARLLLARIGREADDVLRNLGQLPGMAADIAKLRPQSYADVDGVLRQADGLGLNAIGLLFEQYVREAPGQMVHTPAPIAQLLAQLAKVDRDDTFAGNLIFDPYARGGELLAAAAEAALQKAAGFWGSVFDERSALLAGASLASMNVHADLRPHSHSRPDKFDVVLANPPFNSKDNWPDARGDDWILGPPPKGNANFAWVQHCLEALKPGGTTAILLPNSAAQSANPTERALRRALVDAGHLLCVVALPPRMFGNTAIPVSVWILRLDAKAKGVLFIDASRMGRRGSRGKRTLTPDDVQSIMNAYQAWHTDDSAGKKHDGTEKLSAWVSKEHIHARGDALFPGRYVRSEVTRPTSVLVARERLKEQWHVTRAADEQVTEALRTYDSARRQQVTEWTRLLLSEVCEIQAGPSPQPFAKALRKSIDGTVPVIVPKHLRDHDLAVPHEVMDEKQAERFDRYKVREGDVLTVRTGTIGSIVPVREHQENWLMNPALLRIRPKRTNAPLHPDYLVAYLRLPRVQEQLHEIGVATAVPTMSSESLRQLRISLPPMADQVRISAALTVFDEQIAAHRALIETAIETRTAMAAQLLAEANPTD